jgi:hypothetical protein
MCLAIYAIYLQTFNVGIVTTNQVGSSFPANVTISTNPSSTTNNLILDYTFTIPQGQKGEKKG